MLFRCGVVGTTFIESYAKGTHSNAQRPQSPPPSAEIANEICPRVAHQQIESATRHTPATRIRHDTASRWSSTSSP
eukprot:927769-Rhodomonas_salina.1